ncbi:hypothetical protein [Streptomyces luteireticuli]|uniref:hypothetical protein n=1 Tax=Streptomyces luteireticuli TaxID=173858 RepID=UPI00355848A5
MSHRHFANRVCADCEATGLPYIKARDLEPGMLIQDRFNPGPYTEYRIGEIGDVKKSTLDSDDGTDPVELVQWNFAWHRVYRGNELLAENTGEWRVTYAVTGYSEYLPLEPGSVQRPSATPAP